MKYFSTSTECEGATSLDGSTGVENLAWATVSIQGFCWTSSKKGNETQIGSGTALAPSGIGTEILATPPKFMFCDLVLKPNETKTCKCKLRSMTVMTSHKSECY